VFRAGVVERLGVEPEVLTGDEEAALAFAGAMSGLPDDVATPVLVVDVGGGSTEVVLGDHSGVVAARSMDVGSVRLHERHVRHDPPTPEELTAVAADVDAALDECGVPLSDAATVVGIAGTSTQLAALALGLPDYDRDHIHGTVHDAATVRATIDHVVGLTVAERRALPSMHPGRADVVDAGFVIIRRVLARAGADRLTVCETDILDGIAASIR
jgi:exopolyphosphatase/guanosine-5'-triphosphate,3'-diphosphate pyrophosphatase